MSENAEVLLTSCIESSKISTRNVGRGSGLLPRGGKRRRKMKQETIVYESPEYKRSRNAYLMQCAFEYFVAIIVGGSFLTKLLGYVGFNDAAIGIISSLISLTCVFQLLSMLVVQKICNTKKYSMTLQALGRLLFMSLYLIPFLPFAKEYRGVLIVAGIVLAYLCYYLATSVTFKWGNSFLDPTKRASFSAVK